MRGIETVGITTKEESLNKLKYDTIELQLQNLKNNSKYINLELQRIYDQVSHVRLVTEGLYSETYSINNIEADIGLVKDQKGFYWTPIDNQDRSGIFISSGVAIDSKIRQDIKISSFLEPIFKNIIQNNNNVDAIYFMTTDNLTRIYPQINFPDLVERGRIPAEMNCYDYPFFYTVDPLNNPEKKIKWTDTYFDVTDKGWMVTCLAPVYLPNNKFKGIIGIDITIKNLKQNIVNKNIENSQLYTLLLDNKGNNVIYPYEEQKELFHLSAVNKNTAFSANKNTALDHL